MNDSKDIKKMTSGACTDPPGNEGKVVLLNGASCNKEYRIVRILGGALLHSRLHSMGIVPNETIKIVLSTGGGPIAVAVKGVRIALGRGVSHKIEVIEADRPDRQQITSK